MSQQITEHAPDLQAAKETPRTKSVCRDCPNWEKVKERVRVTELLENALGKLESKLKAEDFKPSMADYLKLMQLEKEFEQEQVKEIKVTWVATTPVSEPEK
jgi:hypothetical protein